ncbi:hypothetical protein DWU98_07130 [Dyella monticola]|uniref:Uncharacterized protein n=2 Tax=Dyella monticola TaxID=1927958 RepID=A0A370X3B6_9GAMM|nr:hypothetical protein DWU98_07130 [Dyella monticola]
MQPFALRPKSTAFSVFEGTTTHAMPAQQTSWTQHVAETPIQGLSTKYVKLFTSMGSVANLTRANKTLVKGEGAYAGTKALQSAQTAASLLRINETTTAFGKEAIGVPTHDVGAGIMAEVLAQKWDAKTRGASLGTTGLRKTLEAKYKQLDSVDAMRKQGKDAVLSQVSTSRSDAALRASERAAAKGITDPSAVSAYVQKKFQKHGLGPVPDGVLPLAQPGPFSGGFYPIVPQRVKSLASVQQASWESQPFVVRPGASQSRVYEGSTTQIAPTQGTSWEQHIATPSQDMSSKYTSLFPSLLGVSDLGRANKALVKGGSDTLSPEPGKNIWRGKSYSPQAQLTATLLRVNETTTAFGKESLGSPTHDAGTGIMAEALAIKWQAKTQGQEVNTTKLGVHLTEKFPQLDTVEKMRKQGPDALVGQIAQSRMNAAVMAAQRGHAKGKSDINEYVQRKFAKHGLGQVPSGWAAKFKSL